MNKRFSLKGMVEDAGGGIVYILIDRDTPFYPEPGMEVEVRELAEKDKALPGKFRGYKPVRRPRHKPGRLAASRKSG